MTRVYRVAVIGRRGRHGHSVEAVWSMLDNVEIVAVADEDSVAAAATARQLKARATYSDYRRMLEKERPQIVSVADAHIDSHRDQVLACAEIGAHIVLEKPMCRALDEADAMVRACEMRHVQLVIALQTRYSPVVARIREMIAAGQLGELVEMHARGKEDQRGAAHDHVTHACHLLDLMRMFAGDARWCFARVTQAGRAITRADVRDEPRESIGLVAGDHITANYGFDRGVLGTWATIADCPGNPQRFGIVVRGTKGVVQLTTGYLPAAFWLDDPGWFPGRSRKTWQPITSQGVGQREVLKDSSLLAGNVAMVRELMAALETGRLPSGSMYDARAALEMTLAVFESQRLGQPVALPMRERRHPLSLM